MGDAGFAAFARAGFSEPSPRRRRRWLCSAKFSFRLRPGMAHARRRCVRRAARPGTTAETNSALRRGEHVGMVAVRQSKSFVCL